MFKYQKSKGKRNSLKAPTTLVENGKGLSIDACKSEYIDENASLLSAEVCIGAFYGLEKELVTHMLARFPEHAELISFYGAKIKRVATNGTWPIKNEDGKVKDTHHLFLKIDGFYSDGGELIIDPSYTQFLMTDKKQFTATSTNKIHSNPMNFRKIFVGSYQELQSEFNGCNSYASCNNYKYTSPAK